MINTNPNKKDTDDDGIPDNIELKYFGEQLTSAMTYEQYLASIYCGSDPAKADSDNDGLLDGKAQYNDKDNTIIAPIDPSPIQVNGPIGMWKTHIILHDRNRIYQFDSISPSGRSLRI